MSVRNRIYSPVRYQLRSTDPYGVPIEAWFDREKEEGDCGCGVFAAPAQTAEAEWSRLLPTWRRGWGSNPRAALLPHRRFQGDAVMTTPASRRIHGDPCGTRTHICSMRGCRPDRLDEGANWGPRRSPAKRLRWGEGGNPKHSRRKPGSYETGIPEPCGGISDVVTPAGFEPGIAAVKGRCPVRLDERAMSAPVGAEYFYAITRI